MEFGNIPILGYSVNPQTGGIADTTSPQYKMMAAWEALLTTPMMALQWWPSWFGFAGMEYFSDFAQRAAMDQFNDPTWSRLAGSVIRGGIMTGSLTYWENLGYY